LEDDEDSYKTASSFISRNYKSIGITVIVPAGQNGYYYYSQQRKENVCYNVTCDVCCLDGNCLTQAECDKYNALTFTDILIIIAILIFFCGCGSGGHYAKKRFGDGHHDDHYHHAG
jgi:hypothetical protein